MEKFKIFLIEDDEIIAKSLKKFLENWSYDVYLVEDFSTWPNFLFIPKIEFIVAIKSIINNMETITFIPIVNL